jgi:hypothetical protein
MRARRKRTLEFQTIPDTTFTADVHLRHDNIIRYRSRRRPGRVPGKTISGMTPHEGWRQPNG